MIWSKKRFEILKRDNFRCQYCGKNWKDVTLEVDHIIPKSKWWSDDVNNLITCCRECNMGKWRTRLDSVELWKDKMDDLKNKLKKDFNKKRNWAQLWMINKDTYILLCTFIDYKVNWQESPNSIDARDETYFQWKYDFVWARPKYSSDKRYEYWLKLEKEFKLWWNFCDVCCKWSYNWVMTKIEEFISDICNDSWRTWWKVSDKWEPNYRLNYLLSRELMRYYSWFKDQDPDVSSLKFLVIKYTARKDLIEHFENEGE